ncbi:hypothetical protein cyc_01721 [Cyclospora cayetanensis]|uniref:Uncharacterized protein n=1 Tax=Cyclospora cayetanensis TaxID=88456 RepID=A0A1D3D7B4_9EIME|nr:hypothetical protein cyc_01721 [Cyclospora cayetanensis]
MVSQQAKFNSHPAHWEADASRPEDIEEPPTPRHPMLIQSPRACASSSVSNNMHGSNTSMIASNGVDGNRKEAVTEGVAAGEEDSPWDNGIPNDSGCPYSPEALAELGISYSMLYPTLEPHDYSTRVRITFVDLWILIDGEVFL